MPNNTITTKQEREEFVKMAQEGFCLEKIISKFNRPKHIILYAIRKAGVKLVNPIRYCKECKQLIENDESRNHTKAFCSLKCKDTAEKRSLKTYREKHYVKKGYAGQLKENRKVIYPRWSCCMGHIIQLDFDPKIWQNAQKIRNLECKTCKQTAL